MYPLKRRLRRFQWPDARFGLCPFPFSCFLATHRTSQQLIFAGILQVHFYLPWYISEATIYRRAPGLQDGEFGDAGKVADLLSSSLVRCKVLPAVLSGPFYHPNFSPIVKSLLQAYWQAEAILNYCPPMPESAHMLPQVMATCNLTWMQPLRRPTGEHPSITATAAMLQRRRDSTSHKPGDSSQSYLLCEAWRVCCDGS